MKTVWAAGHSVGLLRTRSQPAGGLHGSKARDCLAPSKTNRSCDDMNEQPESVLVGSKLVVDKDMIRLRATVWVDRLWRGV